MSRRDDELTQFVRASLARGETRPSIEAALGAAGWSPDQIASALRAWSAVDFPLPVPNPRPYVSAREAFLYLVLYSTLFTSAYSLGDLLFSFIDVAVRDPAARDWGLDYDIRWAIARLVVAAPVFLYTAHRVGRMIASDPTKRGSPVRKWLTYVALFIAGSVVVGDVVTLIFYALGGDLTLRFLLKVLTAAVIAGTIFVYYLHDLGRDEKAV
ncbi:MAG: DUF5671 domain-containing protein [Dongiaceae bacterium]